MPSEKTFVTVLCDNPFHKGPEGGPDFSYQPGEDAAATVVTRETARALLEEDEAYRCPALANAEEDEQQQEATLTDIDGVANARAHDLKEAGVEDVEALAAQTPEGLEALAASIDGATDDDIIDWQEQARALVEGEGPEDEA